MANLDGDDPGAGYFEPFRGLAASASSRRILIIPARLRRSCLANLAIWSYVSSLTLTEIRLPERSASFVAIDDDHHAPLTKGQESAWLHGHLWASFCLLMNHSDAHSITTMPTTELQTPASAPPTPAQANTRPRQSPSTSPIPVLARDERRDPPRSHSQQVTVDSAVLHEVLAHASSAARLVSYLDERSDAALVVGPLSDDIDAIVHELCELLGSARAFPRLVQSPALGGPADRRSAASASPEVRSVAHREPAAAPRRIDAARGAAATLVALMLLGAIALVLSGDIP